MNFFVTRVEVFRNFSIVRTMFDVIVRLTESLTQCSTHLTDVHHITPVHVTISLRFVCLRVLRRQIGMLSADEREDNKPELQQDPRQSEST